MGKAKENTMKKLKFMLAAATALGLATASQAATKPGVRTLATENFNAKAVGAFAATAEWSVADANDNESEIVAKDASDNYLKVSVGTDPLLRAIDYTSSTAQQVDLDSGALNIDTMVQFTVTPATDNVTSNGVSDKLMIFVKESVLDAELGTTATNLMVKAAAYTTTGTRPPYTKVFTETDVAAAGVTVDGTWLAAWHALKVKAQKDEDGVVYFNIWVDNVQLSTATVLYPSDTDGYKFPSLLGDGNATLQYVGFAGEGAVDDLVFTQDTTLSSLDFTFAWPTGITPVSYTVDDGTAVAFDNGATSPTVISDAIYPDSVVKFLFQNADGVQKEMSVVASSENDELDASTEPFGWADYLGEAVDGAYEIDTAAELVLFQKGVFSGLTTASTTFKQTANIDMTGVADFYGIGWFKSTDEYDSLPAGAAKGTNTVFAGTYDGQGYTLSNVTVVRHNYAGVFNCLEGTVRNLTVSNFYWTGSAGECGAGIVGNAQGNALIENVTSAGTSWGWDASRGDTGHNSGGIACRAEGNATFRYCVNNASFTSGARRLGGIVGFTGTTLESQSIKFLCCTNNGDITSTYEANKGRGVGGILASPETRDDKVANSGTNNTVISGCANFGTITASNSGNPAGAIVGTLHVNTKSTYTDDGGNTFLALAAMVGNYSSKTVTGLAYAVQTTINNEAYLTTVKAADLAAGNTYTLLANAAPTFAFAALGDTIAFDAGTYTLDGTGVTYAGGKVTSATSGTVTTYTAAALATVTVTVTGGANATPAWTVDGQSVATAPATLTEGQTYEVYYTADEGYAFADNAVTNASGTVGTENITITIDDAAQAQQAADWVEDSSTIAAGTTAATQYPDLAGTALATADAKKLTDWAKANSVAFNAATAGAADYVDAFLLNCAATSVAVAAEKEAFVANITFDAQGTPVVTPPAGKTYNGTLQLKGSTNLTTWTDVEAASTSYQFYKYELSL